MRPFDGLGREWGGLKLNLGCGFDKREGWLNVDSFAACQPDKLLDIEATPWDLPTDDKFWARLHKHFSEPELVEIGYFVAITMGQQRWLRTLDIEHHQVLAGTDASMAPGFEDLDKLVRSKQDPNYWAKRSVNPADQAAE